MPSYFELCIKVNTLAHAQHMHAQPHTANLSMDGQPLYMESSNHSEARMICKYFIMHRFLQGQGVDKSREK